MARPPSASSHAMLRGAVLALLSACAQAPVEPGGMMGGGGAGGDNSGPADAGQAGRGGSMPVRNGGVGGQSREGGADGGAGGAGGAGGVATVDAGTGPEAPPAGTDGPTSPPGNASEACGQGVPVPKEGLQELTVGGMPRKFFLRIPGGYDGKKPWPVVWAFHGAGNKTAAWFDTNTDLRAQLEEKAVLLFPEGAQRSPGNLSWVHMSPENVKFVDAMVDWVKKSLCVDPTRFFATGQSSGGYMAMTLGCQRGAVFRAVATSSGGILEPGTCNGNPPVWIRTGKGDSASTQDSVLKTRDFWVAHKACSKDPPKAIDPSPCVQYSGCQGGVPVIFCHDAGPHAWPDYMTKGMWNLFSSP